MSLKFSDIMKNFYNDETLGIKNEDAPANATGTLLLEQVMIHRQL